MKLYTTIASERGKTVSKSGNEYLEIEIYNETREKVAEIKITPEKIEGYIIHARQAERYFFFDMPKVK